MSDKPLVDNKPPVGSYAIDPELSEIRFTTKHMFGAGKVEGVFSEVVGTIVVADQPAQSTVAASASAASLDSGDKRRDAKVLSPKFLHVEEHPHIAFQSTGVSERGGVWTLEGQLTARGGSAPVHLTITKLVAEPSGLAITAEGEVDRYAHGITAMKGMAARRLKITVTAHATRS